MTNPFCIGLTAEELEEYLLHWYNEVTSLYFTYDSITLMKMFEENWDRWVKTNKPEHHKKLIQDYLGSKQPTIKEESAKNET